MSNVLKRFLELIPQAPEFIGTITHEAHPNYKVQVVDGSGLVSCTAVSRFNAGQRVFIQGNEIKRQAPSGQVIQIEV